MTVVLVIPLGFTALSKIISQRWRDLPEQGKEFYRELARLDWRRHQESNSAAAAAKVQASQQEQQENGCVGLPYSGRSSTRNWLREAKVSCALRLLAKNYRAILEHSRKRCKMSKGATIAAASL